MSVILPDDLDVTEVFKLEAEILRQLSAHKDVGRIFRSDIH